MKHASLPLLNRRTFIAGIGSTAAWPVVASGQQADGPSRIGVLINSTESQTQTQDRLNGLREGLEALGWSEGRNIRIDYRFSSGRTDQVQPLAKELMALKPNVIFASTTPVARVLKLEGSTIPIVFGSVSDPVGSGLIASLSHPGGNLTGLQLYSEGIIGKWLAMLKEIAPNLTRAALIGNPETTPFDYFLRSAQAVASLLRIELVPARVADGFDIERSIASFAQTPNGGLIVLPSATLDLNRQLIIGLAARNRLPAVCWDDSWVPIGGLMSYGVDMIEHWRQAAYFIDRILRGAKPSELPVQARIKYITALNLKTANSLGLTVPPLLLVAADQVIE